MPCARYAYEGYAAATSRRVADEVGVQRALVYYYFPTMDDIYLAVLRRGTEARLANPTPSARIGSASTWVCGT